MTAAPLLLRADELLELHAEELRRSHTLSNGQWPAGSQALQEDLRARADHDELIAVATELRDKERSALAFANALSRAL